MNVGRHSEWIHVPKLKAVFGFVHHHGFLEKQKTYSRLKNCKASMIEAWCCWSKLLVCLCADQNNNYAHRLPCKASLGVVHKYYFEGIVVERCCLRRVCPRA